MSKKDNKKKTQTEQPKKDGSRTVEVLIDEPVEITEIISEPPAVEDKEAEIQKSIEAKDWQRLAFLRYGPPLEKNS
jgi:hypothetical protein